MSSKTIFTVKEKQTEHFFSFDSNKKLSCVAFIKVDNLIRLNVIFALASQFKASART